MATWPEGEVRRDLREWAASAALDAATKTNDDAIMKFSAEVIMEHQRKHNQFSEKITRDAVTLKAEMLVAAAEFEKAKTLLSSGLVAESNMELDLLRLFFMKLDERRQNIEETSESKSLLESLKLLTHDEARKEELEVPKQRIRMMDGRWMNLREELQVEGEVLMGIMEELRIFPVNGNMPSWTARDLTSRSDVSSFLTNLSTLSPSIVIQTGVGPCQPWPRAGGQPPAGGGAVGAAEARGCGRGGGPLLGAGAGGLDPGRDNHRV